MLRKRNAADSDGYGTLRIACRTDAMITTRAEIAVTPVPTAEELTLTISGTEFSKTWESLAAFNDAGETLRPGLHRNPHLRGSKGRGGRQTLLLRNEKHRNRRPPKRRGDHSRTDCQCTGARHATEAFLNYFHDATFTVTTSAGTALLHARCRDGDEAVFVEPVEADPHGYGQDPEPGPARPSTAATLPRADARTDRRTHAPHVPLRRPRQRQRHADDQPRRRIPRRTHVRHRTETTTPKRKPTHKNDTRYENLYRIIYDLESGRPPADGLRKRGAPLQKRGERNDRFRNDGLPERSDESARDLRHRDRHPARRYAGRNPNPALHTRPQPVR